MKTLIYYILIISIIFLNEIHSQIDNKSFFHESIEKNNILDSLLSEMTTAEKVGQLTQIVGKDKVSKELIKEGKIGSYLIGIDGAIKANEIQKIAVEETRLGIPLVFANDVIHGYNTIFPIPLAEASSWNPDLIEKASSIAAIEAAAEGTHWTYAPMVDIARDPRWGRIMEGSGEDPYLGSILAKARVRGFQGTSIGNKNNIAACAKHFVGYGNAEAGKDYNTVDISERSLREIFLPPFKSAVDIGVETLMSGFNDLNGIPASANKFILKKILRNEWGFSGFVISDYNSIGEIIPHGIAEDKKEAAKKGFLAGVDVDMVGDTIIGNIYMDNLSDLASQGIISESLLDNSVRKVLDFKYRLGLFDNPYVDIKYYENNMPSKVYIDKIARKLAQESIVLLKNENNILPLSKDVGKIALIGPLADNKDDLLGNWACDGRAENVVSILEGIKNKISGKSELVYTKGCEVLEKSPNNIRDAVELSKSSDAVILVVGEAKWESGEAASKTNLNISEIQMELIKEVSKTNKPIILVLLNGRPLTIPWIDKNIEAVIEAWYLGDQSGNAIADVIFGDYNPSGKLPVTFPRSVGQIPIYYNSKNTGRPPTEYKYTSKYLDEEVTPLYPFGYGLSYTEFEYSNLQLNIDTLSDGNLEVTIDIQNTGSYDGDEIIQLYIRDIVASVTRPIKELKRFRKIRCLAGEKVNVKFQLNRNDFSLLDVELNKIVEPGNFDIMVGKNSVEYLTKTVFVK